MRLFKLSQTVVRGYDTYDSCVVVAEDAIMAVMMHPYEGQSIASGLGYDWPTQTADIICEYLGEAQPSYQKPAVICASFNAG